MTVAATETNNKYENKDDSDKDQAHWTYEDWGDKRLRPEMTENNVITAKEHEKDPKKE